MKTYEELVGENERQALIKLRKMCRAVNEADLSDRKIDFQAKEGPEIYNNFVTEIEYLVVDDVASGLPDDVVVYYNSLIEDEETEEVTPEDPKELDFGDDTISEPEPEPDAIEEQIEEKEHIESEPVEEEIEEEPVEEESELPKEEPDLTSEPVKEEPLPKMKKLSKSPMSAKIEDRTLTVVFKELKTEKKFNLPEPGDKEALRAVRKAAFAFASENEATRGQKQHISKEFNDAGYYMR